MKSKPWIVLPAVVAALAAVRFVVSRSPSGNDRAQGRVRFEAHPPGRWYFAARTKVLDMQPRGPLELATGAVVPVELALEAGTRVSAVIEGAERERIDELRVFDIFDRRVGFVPRPGRTVSGEERPAAEPVPLSALAPGSYRLVAFRERTVVAEQRFEVAMTMDTVLRLELGH